MRERRNPAEVHTGMKKGEIPAFHSVLDVVCVSKQFLLCESVLARTLLLTDYEAVTVAVLLMPGSKRARKTH